VAWVCGADVVEMRSSSIGEDTTPGSEAGSLDMRGLRSLCVVPGRGCKYCLIFWVERVRVEVIKLADLDIPAAPGRVFEVCGSTRIV